MFVIWIERIVDCNLIENSDKKDLVRRIEIDLTVCQHFLYAF